MTESTLHIPNRHLDFSRSAACEKSPLPKPAQALDLNTSLWLCAFGIAAAIIGDLAFKGAGSLVTLAHGLGVAIALKKSDGADDTYDGLGLS